MDKKRIGVILFHLLLIGGLLLLVGMFTYLQLLTDDPYLELIGAIFILIFGLTMVLVLVLMENKKEREELDERVKELEKNGGDIE